MGRFVISHRSNGEFQFNLKAGNGQIILSSEGYKTKASCLSGIDSVKKNCANASNFERKTATHGKFHFNLKAANGQIIGSSQMYETAEGMENGIESVQRNGVLAEIEDMTD